MTLACGGDCTASTGQIAWGDVETQKVESWPVTHTYVARTGAHTVTFTGEYPFNGKAYPVTFTVDITVTAGDTVKATNCLDCVIIYQGGELITSFLPITTATFFLANTRGNTADRYGIYWRDTVGTYISGTQYSAIAAPQDIPNTVNWPNARAVRQFTEPFTTIIKKLDSGGETIFVYDGLGRMIGDLRQEDVTNGLNVVG